MTRLVYYWRHLDARDRLTVAGLLAVLLVTTWGVAYTTATHRAREARQQDCREHVAKVAARRGYQIVTLADPCAMVRR